MELEQEIDANEIPLSQRPSLAQRIRIFAFQYWSWITVLALAFLLWLPRLSGAIDLRYDAGVYYLLGTSLATGHGYRIPSEPGAPEALQYPPLLPAIVAVYQRALGTNDPAVVGLWLRRSYAVLFAAYGLAALALARRFLAPSLAFASVALCLLHHQTIFLSDLLFTELPFALVAVAFALVAGKAQPWRRGWLQEFASFALAAIGFLLRTAGVALLVAWPLEALTRGRWKVAMVRGGVALVPVLAWQGYVSHVQRSAEYAHPAYEYQRASYQYYNVSYAQNALLVDPFRPELGRVTAGTLISRLTTNSAQLLEALGEIVSTSRAQWKMILNRPQHKLFHGRPIPSDCIFGPVFLLALLVVAGFLLLVRSRAWLTVLLILGSVALVWTTPWPAQFLRYLSPLIIFLDICFILALSGLWTVVSRRKLRRAGGLALAGILVTALATETFTAVRLFHMRQRPEAFVFDGRKDHSYRLFAHDQTWRAWEKAVHWIDTDASRDAIIATTAPHFAYLLTGLKTVLPPMESDAAKACLLLAGVPVSYVIIDKLEFLNVARRYARPAVESAPAEWRLAYSTADTNVYERTNARD